MPETQEKFERVIDLGDGSGVQRFEADSIEELVDKLAKAQENATRKIREQARQIKTGLGLVTPDPETPIPEYKPRQRTADEEWKRTQDLTDPAKARGAIRSIVEDEFGAPVEKVRQALTAIELAQRVNASKIEVDEWVEEHSSDYYPCAENLRNMMGYLESHKMALTKKNCNIAYEDLRDSGLLKARPVAAEKAVEPTEGIPPRPRSSSLRPNASSVVRVPQAPTLTWDDINKMPPAVYDEKMRDPNFRKQVDALPRR